MNKTTYILFCVVLVVGLALGYGGAALFGSRVRNARLKVGDEAPGFRLRDHTGRTIKLSDYLGKKNVVLAFLPGAFTPI